MDGLNQRWLDYMMGAGEQAGLEPKPIAGFAGLAATLILGLAVGAGVWRRSW